MNDITPESPGYRTFRRMIEDADNRVVVSLGGGSIPGLCGNLALLQILEDLGLRQRVDQVWGTSAGAVIGSGWASGASAPKLLDMVKGLDRRGVLDANLFKFATSILASLRPFRRPLPDGIIRGKHFVKAIENGLVCETFEDCPTPFRCIACSDDGRATTKVFRRGRLLPAVFASMALPGIIIPMPDDEGRTYYDGGLVEKTPLPSVINEHNTSGDPRQLLIVSTHFAGEDKDRRTRGFVARLMDTLQVLEDQLWERQLQEARERHNTRVLVLNPRYDDAPMFGFDQAERMFAEAHTRFAKLLKDAQLPQTLGLL